MITSLVAQGAERGVNQSQNVELARKYLTAIERGATGDDLAAFFTMRARFAVFIEYRDGKTARQRSYDSFEPW